MFLDIERKLTVLHCHPVSQRFIFTFWSLYVEIIGIMKVILT